MPYVPSADEDLSVIFRIDLNTNDFAIANQRTRAILRENTGRLRLQVWNMGDCAKTGRVEGAGASLAGLPDAIVLGPRGTPPAEFDCTFIPDAGCDFIRQVTFSGVFGGRRSSRLSMSVRLEKQFLASCTVVPLTWRDPGAWKRNTSAESYSAMYDEKEQALRFDFSWSDPHVGRWFYPTYNLDFPKESLSGAQILAFEVKSAQDKVENDFDYSYLKLHSGKAENKTKRQDKTLAYQAPLGIWERRYVELGGEGDLSDVTALRLGANPKGMRCTFWIRNVRILRK